MIIFIRHGRQFKSEQEIINAGCLVIYYYCLEIRGRWREIEHLMIGDGCIGYYYARDIIKNRYEPELETLYIMKHTGNWCCQKYLNLDYYCL